MNKGGGATVGGLLSLLRGVEGGQCRESLAPAASGGGIERTKRSALIDKQVGGA